MLPCLRDGAGGWGSPVTLFHVHQKHTPGGGGRQHRLCPKRRSRLRLERTPRSGRVGSRWRAHLPNSSWRPTDNRGETPRPTDYLLLHWPHCPAHHAARDQRMPGSGEPRGSGWPWAVHPESPAKERTLGLEQSVGRMEEGTGQRGCKSRTTRPGRPVRAVLCTPALESS